ncbi:hypothetical protein AB0O76_05675 [Streptomyces sp. NPDC086554]|uniref:hypothetical protein n=1 Tax=Streptomyces sp. NPDC086554 TaxID=3154864 RepID=UPI003437122D
MEIAFGRALACSFHPGVPPRRHTGQASGQAVPLSDKKIEEIREANERYGPLSKSQVFRIAGVPEPKESISTPRTAPGAASTAEEGTATSHGECSVVELWGNSDGRWEWDNWYKPSAGPAEFGFLEVDTDGLWSIGSPVEEFDGPHQAKAGSTIYVGPEAGSPLSAPRNGLKDTTFAVERL